MSLGISYAYEDLFLFICRNEHLHRSVVPTEILYAQRRECRQLEREAYAGRKL
jgi:hypothetical protein